MSKTVYVYELYDTYGNVIYVGESIDPKRRLYQHTQRKPSEEWRSDGKFYKQDVTMHIVSDHPNKKEAHLAERDLKLQYGMDWTESHAWIKAEQTHKENQSGLYSMTPEKKTAASKKGGRVAGPINGRKNAEFIGTCPHCNRTIKGLNYRRWHGDRCKAKIA